jgi:BatD DUF11 like domain
MVSSLDFKRFVPRFVWRVAMIAWLCAFAQATEVIAQLDRDTVPAGEGAVLTLRITGDRAERPEMPQVDNFIFTPRGQRIETQLFDGNTTTTAMYEYAVGSMIPGDYQIPAIDLIVAGEKFSTQPLKLKVTAAEDAQAPNAQPPAPPATPTQEEPKEDTGEKRFGFLTVELADGQRQHAYVGEIAPVQIKAWFPAGAQMQPRSRIQPEGKGFTLQNLSEQPQQTDEVRDGKHYAVLTWFGGITATQSGKLAASLSLDATVAVPDRSAQKPQRRQTGGPFDDPFFDRMFDRTPMIQKEVTLKSDDQEIEVRSLPSEGRPSEFTGAVGDFKFGQVQWPGNWNTGEPQQIRAEVTGSGNFTLMKAPELLPAVSWKSYAGKDEFTPGDYASFSGTKTFLWNSVPQKGGNQEVKLNFSYFDPAAEMYKTITSPIQTIQVIGKDVVADEAIATTPSEKPSPKIDGGLRGLHPEISPRRSPLPLISRPSFIPLLVGSGLLYFLGQVISFFRNRRNDPQRRARAKMEQATRDAVAAAATAREIPAFFAAARLALQQRLGALWNQPAQAITAAEVEARLPADSPVTRFFQAADRFEYGLSGSEEISPQWRTLLDEGLASIPLSNR